MRVALLALSASAVLAQTPTRPPTETRTPSAHRTPSPPQHTAQLPVTRVALYKSGVGFFQHSGRVLGDQSVTIDLTSAQLNDVLQTLTVLDRDGGHVSGAGYNSTTPLDQQLKTLPLGLGEAPTSDELYETLRGARVDVHSPGAALSGRLLSVETRTTPASESHPATERHLLTVAADSGDIRTFELTPATTVRVLDPALRNDLSRYLQLLDTNRSEALRHLTLFDRGTGSRTLEVSYLSEVPIWKSTYRILLTTGTASSHLPSAAAPSAGTATLQGWSVVDNTTGEDWKDVQLSLIAGSPQSFIQPLAQPIYSRRPEIPIAEDAQLTPQTHDSGANPADVKMLKEDGAPPQVAGVAGMSGVGSGSGNGIGVAPGAGGYMGGGGGTRAVAGPLNGRTFSGRNSVGGVLGGIGSASESVAVAAAPVPYETAAAQSIIQNASTTSAFDDFFAYNLTDPVSIRKNESALVPILQTPITTESVTLWNPQGPQALRALWITNTSPLTLDRGSFTVIEDGSFGGEGLLEAVHPKERRLLSYAVDQAVRVSTDHTSATQQAVRLTVSRGVLTEQSEQIAEVEYLVHNAAPTPRLVIVEQPVRPGWTLDSLNCRSNDPKPSETTPTVYRFRVSTAPGETVRLHIGERLPTTQAFRLVDYNDEQLTQILQGSNAGPALLAQLQPIFDARRRVASLDAEIATRQHAIQTIVDDQKRLRDNIAALKGGAEERSLSRRYTAELNAQEDTLAILRHDLATLEADRTTARNTLNTQLESLTIT